MRILIDKLGPYMCYVIFISYLFSCIIFHFRQVMQDNYLRTRSLCFTLLRWPPYGAATILLRTSLYVKGLCLEKYNQQYFFKSSISGRTYSQPISSGFCPNGIVTGPKQSFSSLEINSRSLNNSRIKPSELLSSPRI